MNSSRFTLITSWLLAAIMIYGTAIKLWSYSTSKVGFDFFPFVENHHRLVFWGLISLQLCVAFFLIFRKTRLAGLYAAFFLLISLSTYLYLMLHYSTHVPCFCTGIIPRLSWQGHLWFTIGFTVLAGAGVALLPKNIHARG